jgi:hypothetical protein
MASKDVSTSRDDGLEQDDNHGGISQSILVDHIARTVGNQLNSADPPLPNSDNSYVMSLCFKRYHELGSVEMYHYPNQLPKEDVLVDMVGWVTSQETARYLMMGYRVWNRAGYRLHLHGSPVEHASINVLRRPTREICSQDLDDAPDLAIQMQVENSGDPIEPWEARINSAPITDELLKSMPDNITRVRTLFNDSRVKVAQPCYTLDDKSHESLEGSNLTFVPLFKKNDEALAYPFYADIGLEQSFLSKKYPKTESTVQYRARNGDILETKGPESTLCELCSAIDFDDLFEWGLTDVKLDFGSSEDLYARDWCSFCRLMGLLCRAAIEFYVRNEDGVESSQGPARFALKANLPLQVLFERNPFHGNSTKPFLVLSQNPQKEYFGPIVSLRTVRGDIRGKYTLQIPAQMNYETIKRMIHHCDVSHGPDCGRKMSDTAPQDMVLVDVEKMCLVRVPNEPVKYITLSYVWGKDRMFTTVKSNWEELQKPGALQKVPLGQTLLDTFAIARGIKVNFVWVDTLCIVQDDDGIKTTQIKNMSSIFGQSYFSVVALTGTGGSSPLAGIDKRERLVEAVHGMPITARFPGLAHDALSRVYETRAWTLQERMISRRNLYIGENQVFFECGKGVTSDHEQLFPEMDWYYPTKWSSPLGEIVQDLDIRRAHGIEPRKLFSLFNLAQFNSLVSQYSHRQMSYKSDIENAFVGVQDVIAQKAGWLFVAGLPVDILDWALLWIPSGKMERRKWTIAGELVGPPSWSWFGWEGQVSYSFKPEELRVPLREIQPLVESFCIQSDVGTYHTHRKPSEIWHGEFTVQNDQVDADISSNAAQNDDISLVKSIFGLSLSFDVEAVPCNAFDLEAADFEWLHCRTIDSGLRISAQRGYRGVVLGIISSHPEGEGAFQIIALAHCKVRQSIRGGTWGEEKSWLLPAIAVMLIQKCDDKQVHEKECFERVAIAYTTSEKWESLGATKKKICLI